MRRSLFTVELRPSAATRCRAKCEPWSVSMAQMLPVRTKLVRRSFWRMVTPEFEARSRRRESRSLRRTAISAFPFEGSGTSTGDPLVDSNLTVSSFEWLSRGTREAISKRSNMSQHDGLIQSPHTLCLGNSARSSRSTEKPARAQRVAQVLPAGPAPTMATSNRSTRGR